MNQRSKRSIIVALLKAKRPDLANAVARLEIKAQHGESFYDWVPKATVVLKGLIRALVQDKRNQEIPETLAAILKAAIPETIEPRVLKDLRVHLLPKKGEILHLKKTGEDIFSRTATAALSPEDRIAAIRRIVEERQYAKIEGVAVDLFTASAIIQVYDKLNDQNKAKLAAMPVPKIAAVVWKLIGKK